jgi:O-antigen ligase
MLLLLFFLALMQIAFRVIRKPMLPSFWVIWPQIGLVSLAVVSEFMVQLAWPHTVPHKVLNNPIIQEEITGVAIYFFPLITLFTTTVILTKNERYIQYILRGYMILGVVGAVILLIDFRRLGGNVYSFRFTEPSIWWMTLRSLCQLLVQGAVIGYANFLYATKRRPRLIYAGVTVICLLSIYLSLQNSWWVEVGIAMIVMTFFYSRRLLWSCCIAIIPLSPLLKAEYDKLATLKANDLNRFTIWQDMIRVWSKQPVFGVAPGNVWAYDQVYTQLPLTLRNLGQSGLGVAHNGYLQTFAETGVVGLGFYLASIAVLILTSRRLFRRSPIREERAKGIWGLVGGKKVPETEESSEKRKDRILAISALGLVCGSAAADLFTSSFFLPPRQMHTFVTLTPVVTSWIVWGCVVYKDQLWRIASRRSKAERAG